MNTFLAKVAENVAMGPTRRIGERGQTCIRCKPPNECSLAWVDTKGVTHCLQCDPPKKRGDIALTLVLAQDDVDSYLGHWEDAGPKSLERWRANTPP
jgi:hypothetical protein